MLWINFTIDIFLSIGLGMGNPTPGLMERPPRKAGERILPARLFTRLVIAGVIIAACTLGVMQYAVAGAHWSLDVAHTMGMTTLDFMNRIFGTTNLNFGQWLICIVVSTLILWVTELAKIFRRQAEASFVAEPETVSAAQRAA